MTTTHDPVREAEELREQLGSDRRRLLIFFGAGTSQAVGIDGAAQLTANIRSDLAAPQQAHYDRLLKQAGTGANLEVILDRVRLCRELIGDSKTAEADSLPQYQVRFAPGYLDLFLWLRERSAPNHEASL
jgi:hypothetical protein